MNLGNPVEMTILDFAERIRSRFGNGLGIDYHPLPSDDPKIRRPDITKAKSILGWEPVVPLDDGLTVTIEYFKNKVSGQTGGISLPLNGKLSDQLGVL